MLIRRLRPLVGEFSVPGDKSVSHRALIIAAQMLGKIFVKNVCNGNDILATIKALNYVGVRIDRVGDADYCVYGVGVGGFVAPNDIFQMENSRSSASFFMGLVASYAFTSFFTGDASLRGRSMRDLLLPLELIGARVIANKHGGFPMGLIGTDEGLPITYDMPSQSAQLKTTILFAGLNIRGKTTVIEREPFSRDHTEVMLAHCGADIKVNEKDGVRAIELCGQKDLDSLQSLRVHGDPSSAAFIAAIAILVPGSDVLIKEVMVNPKRTGFYSVVSSMGADVLFCNERIEDGEQVADIRVKSSTLVGVRVGPEMFNACIDEYPILCILAACASGDSCFEGLTRLRNKESDRILSVTKGLTSCGVEAGSTYDSILIHGAGNPNAVMGGVEVDCMMDHRVAMSFLILGLVAKGAIVVRGREILSKSFPGLSSILDSVCI